MDFDQLYKEQFPVVYRYAAQFLRLCSEVIGLSSPPQTGRNIF